MIKIGNVCECQHGKLGVVTSISDSICKGIGLNGTTWQSKDPKLVADTVRQLVSEMDFYTPTLIKKITG